MNDPYIPTPSIDSHNSISPVPPISEPLTTSEPCDTSCGCSTSHKIGKRILMGVAVILLTFNGALYASPQLGQQIASYIPVWLDLPSNVVGHARGCDCAHSPKDFTEASMDNPSGPPLNIAADKK